MWEREFDANSLRCLEQTNLCGQIRKARAYEEGTFDDE